jgi:hypothetical protein
VAVTSTRPQLVPRPPVAKTTRPGEDSAFLQLQLQPVLTRWLMERPYPQEKRYAGLGCQELWGSSIVVHRHLGKTLVTLRQAPLRYLPQWVGCQNPDWPPATPAKACSEDVATTTPVLSTSIGGIRATVATCQRRPRQSRSLGPVGAEAGRRRLARWFGHSPPLCAHDEVRHANAHGPVPPSPPCSPAPTRLSWARPRQGSFSRSQTWRRSSNDSD